MKFEKCTRFQSAYECVSRNQHGARYKRALDNAVKTCTMAADKDEPEHLVLLIALSNQLGIPLHWDFERQQASITVTAASAMRW